MGQPRLFKLIALNCTAKGGRLLLKEHDETYPETAFHDGQADELVQKGFLIEVTDQSKTVRAKDLNDVDDESDVDIDSNTDDEIEQIKQDIKENR